MADAADPASSPARRGKRPAEQEASDEEVEYILRSPQPRYARKRRAAAHRDPSSPTAPAAPASNGAPTAGALVAYEPTAEVRQAKTSRTSMAARPPAPSASATAAAKDQIFVDRNYLRSLGYSELPPDGTVVRNDPTPVPSGPIVRLSGGDKATIAKRKMLLAHLGTVRSKSVSSLARHASWLVPKRCKLFGHHLLKATVSANSVNCVITGKIRASESKSLQITRYNFIPLADAQAAQQVSCTMTLAYAQSLLSDKFDFREAGARNAVSMSDLSQLRAAYGGEGGKSDEMGPVFPVCASSQLVPNCVPIKLTATSMGSVGLDLARAELGPRHAITEAAGTLHATYLRSLCRQCTGQSVTSADALWSMVGLISCCGMTPAGRALLGSTNLTDFDYALSGILEMYARSEIQRREKFDATNKDLVDEEGDGRRSAGGGMSSAGSVDHELANLETLARKELAEMGAQMQALLSAKKRRDVTYVDPVVNARWWVAASETKHAAVLKTLMCNNLEDAKRAAIQNLKYQCRGLPEVGNNPTLQEMSVKNAQDCVKEVAGSLALHQNPPRFVPCADASPSNGAKPAMALERFADELRKTVIFASVLAPKRAQPHCEDHEGARREAGSAAIAWTVACIEPRSHSMFEKLKMAEAIRARSQGKKAVDRAERAEQDALRLHAPTTPEGAGFARSFFSHPIQYALTPSQKEAARRFAAAAAAADAAADADAAPAAPTEPFATHSPALATGLLVTDILTRWMAGKTRKVEFSNLQLAPSTHGENPAAILDVNSASPLPLAVITDVRATYGVDTAQVGLSLALDGAIRLPEALQLLVNKKGGFDWNSTRRFLEGRALLWAGISQASLIGNLGNVLTCGAVNASIASSRRLTMADNSRWLGLSCFDCFTGGLLNVEPSFMDSPYAGAYGPVFDTGISPPGNEGKNINHDGRQHGSFSISQDLSDELAKYFAEHFFAIDHENREYAPVPVAMRGIPHMLLAGINTALDEFTSGLETLRADTGRQDAPTVDGVFVLPYSSVTQALAPVVENSADSAQTCGVRSEHVKRGHSYQPTATAEADALLREPLFRQPSVATTYDNPFATAYDYAETFYNLANGLVLVGRMFEERRPQLVSASLIEAMGLWTDSDADDVMPPDMAVCAADAMLMIACMFPETHGIGKPMIPEVLATAIPALHRAVRNSDNYGDGGGEPDERPSYVLAALVDADLLQAGRELCNRINWAWPDLQDLIDQLHDLDGRHDLSFATRTTLRHNFERAVRASFYFQIDKDTKKIPYGNPAYGATTPAEIGRIAVDPVIVGVEEERETARGGIIGIKPHALRQVAMLAMGSHLESVQLQVVRNEGCLALRVSSAPDVLKVDGSERSNKSKSPVQMESDSRLFGTTAEKLVTCALQRAAWDANIRLLAPVIAKVSPPAPAAWRRRCRHGAQSKLREEALRARSELTLSTDEKAAKAHILAAARFDRERAEGGVGGGGGGGDGGGGDGADGGGRADA